MRVAIVRINGERSHEAMCRTIGKSKSYAIGLYVRRVFVVAMLCSSMSNHDEETNRGNRSQRPDIGGVYAWLWYVVAVVSEDVRRRAGCRGRIGDVSWWSWMSIEVPLGRMGEAFRVVSFGVDMAGEELLAKMVVRKD